MGPILSSWGLDSRSPLLGVANVEHMAIQEILLPTWRLVVLFETPTHRLRLAQPHKLGSAPIPICCRNTPISSRFHLVELSMCEIMPPWAWQMDDVQSVNPSIQEYSSFHTGMSHTCLHILWVSVSLCVCKCVCVCVCVWSIVCLCVRVCACVSEKWAAMDKPWISQIMMATAWLQVCLLSGYENSESRRVPSSLTPQGTKAETEEQSENRTEDCTEDVEE